MMRWISVNDSLPEITGIQVEWSKQMLVCNNQNMVWFESYHYKNGWNDSITHWMPVPEPPVRGKRYRILSKDQITWSDIIKILIILGLTAVFINSTNL